MRIISGVFRGRRLQTPKGLDTRPTLDRVRETIFNVLQHHNLEKRQVLDLFAGTGAMGLEALSRGCASLVAVDNRTGSLISKNAQLCQVSDLVTVIGRSLEGACAQLSHRQFDLVFADPPYQKGYLERTVQLLVKGDLLVAGALVVFECHKKDTFTVPPSWECFREQSFGDTRVYYYRVGEGELSCE